MEMVDKPHPTDEIATAFKKGLAITTLRIMCYRELGAYKKNPKRNKWKL
jgi:hypothetical protein